MNYKKNINKLLSGRLITNLADSLFIMAVTWYFTINFDDATYLGILNFLLSLSGFMLLFFGPIVDKLSPKKMLMGLSLLQLFLVGVVIVSTRYDLVIPLYIFVTISTISSEITYPIESVVIVRTVPDDKIESVNATFYAAYKVVDLIFNGIGGFVIKYLGIIASLIISLFSFVTSFFVFRTIEDSEVASEQSEEGTENTGYLKDLLLGLQFLREPMFLKFYLPLVCMNFVYGAVYTVLPIIFKKYGSSGSVYYGLLLLFSGFGSVIGAKLVKKIPERFKIAHVLSVCLFVEASGWIVLQMFLDNLFVVYASITVSGIGLAAMNVFFISIFQKMPPKDMVARVDTLIQSIFCIFMMISSFIGSIVANRYEISNLLLVYGIVTVISGIYYSVDKSLLKIDRCKGIDWGKYVAKD